MYYSGVRGERQKKKNRSSRSCFLLLFLETKTKQGKEHGCGSSSRYHDPEVDWLIVPWHAWHTGGHRSERPPHAARSLRHPAECEIWGGLALPGRLGTLGWLGTPLKQNQREVAACVSSFVEGELFARPGPAESPLFCLGLGCGVSQRGKLRTWGTGQATDPGNEPSCPWRVPRRGPLTAAGGGGTHRGRIGGAPLPFYTRDVLLHTRHPSSALLCTR